MGLYVLLLDLAASCVIMLVEMAEVNGAEDLWHGLERKGAL